jgi:NAD(P)-dependent dehydrogenase (short-subunit alcohol dehydrogenase family)
VSQPEEIRTLIDATVSQFGRLDCLINNAGYHPPVKRIDDFDLADLQDVWQTNFVSQFVACRHALPHLRKTRGSIINMSSLVGDIGQEGATIYCSTKGAINAFTKALAIEEATNGVRVNAVLPGNIVSDSRVQFLRTAPNAEEIDRWIDANQHNGRSGTNEEVGQLCLFLASAAASYITGTLQIISAGAELGYGVKYPTTFL